MITLNDIIGDLLSIEKKAFKKPTIIDRFKTFANRKSIEKQLEDERIADTSRVIKNGEQAEAFLNSPYYRDIIDPFVRQNVTSGLQKLLTEYEDMTEAQLKSEISVIRKCLTLLAHIKLKVVQADLLKEQP